MVGTTGMCTVRSPTSKGRLPVARSERLEVRGTGNRGSVRGLALGWRPRGGASGEPNWFGWQGRVWGVGGVWGVGRSLVQGEGSRGGTRGGGLWLGVWGGGLPVEGVSESLQRRDAGGGG